MAETPRPAGLKRRRNRLQHQQHNSAAAGVFAHTVTADARSGRPARSPFGDSGIMKAVLPAANPGGIMSNLSSQIDLLIAVLETLPIAVATADRRGIVRSVNGALTSLTGYTAEQAVGQPVGQLSFGTAEHSLDPIVLVTFEDIAGRKEDGEDLRLTGQCADAPERKQIDPLAVGTPGDFELFFNLVPDLACIVSTDGYFKRVNPAWESTLGYTQEELLKTPMLELIHPEDLERTVNEVAKQSREHRTKHFVNRYRCKNGSYRLFYWTTTFNRDDSTRFGVARDITEQRLSEESLQRSEEALQKAKDVAEGANRSKSEFLA